MNRRLLTAALGLSAALFGATFFGQVRSLRASEAVMEQIEISAPILPRVLVLYQREGNNFPTTPAELAAHAHASALTYDFLLHDCAAAYPAIVIPGPGEPPTSDAQNATNFEQVAQCSYEKYTAKPYWIPALVDTVDICGQELGPSWRLPNETDVASLSQDDRAQLAAALSTPNAGSSWATFYFSLRVWVHNSDGALGIADLSPNAPLTIQIPTGVDPTLHYEGNVALRCLRRTEVAGTNPGSGGSGGASDEAAGGAQP
jgi:hypothetical protein